MSFDAGRKGSGVQEWAEHSFNIQVGCSNNCLYGYCAELAARYGRRTRDKWHLEVLTKNAHITSYPKKEGVVMAPTTHDITPFNMEAYIRTAKLILAKGNRLLIVTKPRLECVTALLKELAPWKEQILFRFTIGSMDPSICSFWEPGAPPPAERLSCLRLARETGFATSVSVEPMLHGVGSTLRVFDDVSPWVSESVWIGKLNKPRLRVDMSVPEYAAAVADIEHVQRDEEILRLYRMLKNQPQVRWKDSIKEVLARHGVGVGE